MSCRSVLSSAAWAGVPDPLPAFCAASSSLSLHWCRRQGAKASLLRLHAQDESGHGGGGSSNGIFSLSDTEDLKLRERASIILGDAAKSRARMDAFDIGLRR